jgi:hypothetical protein
MTELLIAPIQVSADYCERIIFPADGARGSFSQQSMRGDTITLLVHQGAGHDWVYVHTWDEPRWKNGNLKEPKKTVEGEQQYEMPLCRAGCGMEKGEDWFATG